MTLTLTIAIHFFHMTATLTGFITKGSAVLKISSRQTLTEILNVYTPESTYRQRHTLHSHSVSTLHSQTEAHSPPTDRNPLSILRQKPTLHPQTEAHSPPTDRSTLSTLRQKPILRPQTKPTLYPQTEAHSPLSDRSPLSTHRQKHSLHPQTEAHSPLSDRSTLSTLRQKPILHPQTEAHSPPTDKTTISALRQKHTFSPLTDRSTLSTLCLRQKHTLNSVSDRSTLSTLCLTQKHTLHSLFHTETYSPLSNRSTLSTPYVSDRSTLSTLSVSDRSTLSTPKQKHTLHSLLQTAQARSPLTDKKHTLHVPLTGSRHTSHSLAPDTLGTHGIGLSVCVIDSALTSSSSFPQDESLYFAWTAMPPPHLKSLKFKRKRTISVHSDHAINNLAGPVIVLLDIFQTGVTCVRSKVVHRNQSDNHCNWSDTLPSTDGTTRALPANIMFPSLSSPPPPPPPPSQTYSLCVLWLFFFLSLFWGEVGWGGWESVKQNNS